MGLGAGGRGGHHPPVLVPGVGGLGAAVRLAVEGEYSTVQYSTVQYLAVEGEGLVAGHDLGLGVLRDVGGPLPP